ncbi:hypothetical protein [Psychrobacillus vulpis]|uniref:Uncharacterized protein n=1 Tax=Psychrobacillus vulpis TaxID=2325572 RepID=A0A544TSQ0_9BACI|nr:hypothetical protein [Psychrobacillus vulpis]TQR20464.1 hypothetical protein FG384_06815 [Psychrobacillus vulpis]
MVADDSLTWSGSISPPNGLPMLWGLATDNIKSIVITSENDIQPNKLKIQDNLWLWYAPINTDKLNMPIMMKAYDEKGNILYGEKF